jgi:integrase
MAILADCPVCHRKQSNSKKKCIECGEDLDRAKQSKRVNYWIKYRVPGGKQRLEKVGDSIEEARDAEGKRRGQKREGRFFEMLPESKDTFAQLAKWFLDIEKNRVLSGGITEVYYRGQKTRLNNFNSVYGDSLVSAVSPADLESYKAKRKQAGKSDSYIDQELGTVASMINTAFENEKVSGRSYKIFKNRKRLLKRKDANRRTRVLSLNEYNKLMAELSFHLKAIVATGFWTGMRRGEILNLTWDKVNLKKRMICLDAGDTKEGQAKRVPISETLKAILRNLPKAIHDDHVFLYKGKAIVDPIEGLKNGCEKAGIIYGQKEKGGFVFKDLRRTAKTNMRKAGIDRNLRMAIFGHTNPDDMDARYDAIDESDLLKAIDRFEDYLLHPLDEISQKSDTV